MDIILAHDHSDFDALASTVAASKVFPGAIPVLQSSLDGRVGEFVAVHKDALGLKHLDQLDLNDVSRVIVVDTQTAQRLGTTYTALNRAGVEWVVYDHHPRMAGDLPPTPGRRELVGSCTTMLVEEIIRQQIPISELEATVMALGIYTDTGHLTFASTRPADAFAVAHLLAAGANLTIVGEYSHVDLNLEQQALLQSLIEKGGPRVINGHCVLLAGAQWPDYVEGISLITHKLLGLFNLDMAVIVVEMEGKRTQFVARTRLAGVDLRELLAEYAPRGHAQAVSAHAKGLPVDDALETLERLLPGLLPAEPTASDLMSCPVHALSSDLSVTEAGAALLRYGHSALPVVDHGRLVGVFSRRDIERSAHHGFADSRVSSLMSREVITVSPESPLSAIEAAMIAHDIGRLPVLHGEALVGIVTRTDVLRVKYSHRADRREAIRHQTSEMARRLTTIWPVEWLTLVRQVAELAGDRPLFLVGGAVRDILLDRQNLDVDLVVEGDAIALATEVADTLPGSRLRTHAAFGTAQLSLADGRKLDFACARTEFYAHPAALPTIELSSIKQDLARRDFTVNCLALQLNIPRFGELLDFFNSRQDMARRALRVLHNLSFIEDPTRVLRAVRFEQQLGFKLEPESEDFARYALGSGAFDGLAGERNKVELKRILSMPNSLPAAQRLSELGAWRLLHPALAPDGHTWRQFRGLRRVLGFAGTAEVESRWLAYLTVLLAPFDMATIEQVMAKLLLTGPERRIVVESIISLGALSAAVRADHDDPLSIYLSVKGLAPVSFAAVFVLADRPPLRQSLKRHWRDWRTLQLFVDGSDLQALGLPPGPRYGQILQEVLAARLAGHVRTRPEELRLLTELAGHESGLLQESPSASNELTHPCELSGEEPHGHVV